MMSAQTTPVIVFSSPLGGVDDDAWTAFCRAMMTAPFDAVSKSNALGAFEMMPLRLGEIGLLRNLKRSESKKSKRTIWIGTFIPPMTDAIFLKNPAVQYRAFCSSMTDYASKIASGAIERPTGMSLSGALALLHRARQAGLVGPRFPATQAAFDRAEGIF